MKQLYSFRTGLEAHDLRFFLLSHGIEATVFGDNNAFEAGFSFTPASAPGVFVNEYDWEKARLLAKQFVEDAVPKLRAGKWMCPSCGEKNEASFEICWKCQGARGDSELDLAPTVAIEREEPPTDGKTLIVQTDAKPGEQFLALNQRPAWQLWVEILIVFAVIQPFFTLTDIFASWLPLAAEEWLASHWYVEAMLGNLTALAIVLVIVQHSREHLTKFGLQLLSPLWDLLSGWLLMLITVILLYIAADSFGHFLKAFPSLNEYLENDYQGDFENPSGIYGLVVLGCAALCIALGEEIAFRGFLIPRFEEVFESTPWAVIVSAILFASIHVSQNLMGMWQAFVFGLIFGIVFVRFRRILPLVVAHATIDFLVFLRDSS